MEFQAFTEYLQLTESQKKVVEPFNTEQEPFITEADAHFYIPSTGKRYMFQYVRNIEVHINQDKIYYVEGLNNPTVQVLPARRTVTVKLHLANSQFANAMVHRDLIVDFTPIKFDMSIQRYGLEFNIIRCTGCIMSGFALIGDDISLEITPDYIIYE
jgi:hypothetical protein